MPDTIRAFRRARPNVRLELREATTAAQIAGLRGGTLDAGIVIPPIAEAAGIELHDFDQDRLCIALSLGHHLAGKDDLCVADIADEDFVLWPMIEGRGFHLQVIRLCTDAGFVPRVTQEAHGMHAVLSLVAVGAGVSVVPESMRQFRPDQITYHRSRLSAVSGPPQARSCYRGIYRDRLAWRLRIIALAAVRRPEPEPPADHGSGRSSPLQHALRPPRSGERDEADLQQLATLGAIVRVAG
nr:LysR family substrate-binding domain-containing protein [Rhodovulum sulfidophilum]